jgi:small subunit ribosomal protein S4
MMKGNFLILSIILARFSYGISERQFFRYVKEAMARKGGNSANDLVSRLEARLDNVVFRLGFAATRRQARQLVSHGHIKVNGKRITVPSYKAEKGDVIEVREESRTSPFFANLSERIETRKLPSWLKVTDDIYKGEMDTMGETAASELIFDPAVIIQFYSR